MDSGFILKLADGGGKSEPTLRAPSYKKAGGQKIRWETTDSTNFLVEWLLGNGAQLTEDQAHALAARSNGPSLRRLCRGVGSFAALQANAGYTFC